MHASVHRYMYMQLCMHTVIYMCTQSHTHTCTHVCVDGSVHTRMMPVCRYACIPDHVGITVNQTFIAICTVYPMQNINK